MRRAAGDSAIPAVDYTGSMFEAEYGNRGGAKEKALALDRGQFQPAGCQDAQQVAVSEEKRIPIGGKSTLDHCTGAGANLLHGLAVRNAVAKDVPIGAGLANLRAGAPFIIAVIPFDEVRFGLRLSAKAGQFAGAPRALKRAGQHQGKLPAGEFFANRKSLRFAGRCERNIGQARVCAGNGPGRLPMANQPDHLSILSYAGRQVTFCMMKFWFCLLSACLVLSAQSTLNMSRDLIARGIATSNLTPNQPTLDARPLFEAAVAYAGKTSVTTLTADPGSYYFLTLHSANQHVLLSGAANLTIDLQNSDLWFAVSNTTAMECSNCISVTMQNFTVDYQQLPFTQAAITAVDSVNRRLTFQTLPGWQTPADFNSNRAPDNSDTIWMFIFRNGVPITQVGRLGASRPVSGNTIQIGNLTDPWAQPANIAAIQPGDTLVWTDRGGPAAIGINGGQKVTVHNVSIYSAGLLGLYFGRTSGATADHVQVIPRPGTARLISTNADGIHVSFALANNTFTNNIVRRTCDDALAMSALWIATVTGPPAGVTVQVARSYASPFAVGAPVSFVSTVDASVVGSANIVAESPAVGSQSMTDGEMVTLTLDKAVPGLAAGFGMIDNDPLKRGTGSVIANNTVQEGVFSRGVWLSGMQSTSVHDNVIQRTSNAGILVQQLTGGQFTGGPSSAITIKNNLVDGAMTYGGISAGPLVAAASIHSVAASGVNGQVSTRPFSSFFVTGNRVTNSPRTAIRLENVAGGNLTDNTIQGFGLNPAANVYLIPPCCETMAQYIADFAMPVLSTNSLLTISGNASTDSGTLVSTVSSAGYFPRVAVDSWVVAFGSNLASTAIATSLPFPTSLGGIIIQVTDSAGVTRSAPIYYTSPAQVAYLVPDGTAAGIATVKIGGATGAAQVDTVAPGIYSANASGTGVAAALAAVYTAAGGVNPEPVFQCAAGAGTCVTAPLAMGGASDVLIVSLYGTGFRNFSAMRNVVAEVGGVMVAVQYAGAVAGNPGLDQVNLVIPASLAGSGEVPVVLTVDGQTANVVTINLKQGLP